MHRCGKKTASGEDCSSTFTKPGNLKRHVRDIHQNRSTIFIDCNPGARRRRTRHPVAERPSPPLRDTTCVSSLPSPPTLAPSVGAKGDRMLQPGTLEGTFADSMPLQVDDSAWNNRIDHLASEFEPENALGGDIAFDGADEHPQEVHEVEPETQGMNGPGSTRKRRRSSSSDSYIYLGTSRDVMPVYEVKQSKKTPGQQRGLQWLTVSARDQFRSAHDALLGAWGVTSEHTGTCVLCPEDWRFSDPLKLMDLFGKQNRPSPRLPRAWYSHSDHATTMSRAVAWFSSWPRTGGELDNFLGAGPYKPMHGSHLCHHDHCIIHLTYERGDINEDRKICCRRARFLRQERRDVPEHCRRHKPPCLMQVSWSMLKDGRY